MRNLAYGRFLITALFGLVLVTGCTESKIRLGENDGSVDGATDGGVPDGTIRCGDNICGDGEYCCNESCGTCAPMGAGCPAIECTETCGGEVCAEDVGFCCAGCGGEEFCPAPGGACPDILCPPVCPDGTECESGNCCPSAGCDDGFYCAAAGESCAALPVICPNECPDGSACAEGSLCCAGCFGDYFCSPDGGCPDISCPPPPVCGDGIECPSGECCSDCRGSSFCSDDDLACPLCPDPGCDPQDARGEGMCAAFFGYAWNGSACVGLSGCSCAGADCAATFDSPEECQSAYWSCMGPPACDSDAACSAGAYCEGCAWSSCPFCDDCVAGCIPHACPTEREPTCRALRPECGDNGVAVVEDGCWVCVDASTCEPIDDCRVAECPPDSRCTACEPGMFTCLRDGEACAF